MLCAAFKSKAAAHLKGYAYDEDLVMGCQFQLMPLGVCREITPRHAGCMTRGTLR